MIGLASDGRVSFSRGRAGENWVLLSGVYLSIAYQIVPLRERDGAWRWTFYPPIGDGDSHAGEHIGSDAEAEAACMRAIREFVNDSGGWRYSHEALLAHYS